MTTIWCGLGFGRVLLKVIQDPSENVLQQIFLNNIGGGGGELNLYEKAYFEKTCHEFVD